MSAPVRVPSRPFATASAPDSMRLEQLMELLSVLLDDRSLMGAVGMVVRVTGLTRCSVTSRSLAEATVPGLKQPESPNTLGIMG